MAKKPYKIEDVQKEIAQKIRALRINAGYTSYEDFALDHNIDRKQYWRMEKGSNLTLKSLLVVLNIHQISLSDFFEGL